MGLMNTFSNALSTLSNGFASMFGASKDHNQFQMFREGISGPPGNHIVTNPYPPPYQQPQDLDRYAGETNEMRIAYLKFHATEPAFQAAIDGKVASIAALDVSVLPADEASEADKRAAEFIRDAVENSPGGWSGLITKILQPAFLLGFSVTEKWYAGVADEPYFVRIRPKWRGFWAPRRYASIDTNYLRVQLNDARELIGIINTRRGLEGYTPERVIFYTNRKLFENPYGRSDGRSVYRACQLIDNAFKLWYIAMKNYSAPFLTGKTKSQGKIRAAFETALQTARAGGYILCADEDVVEVVNLAAATSFQAFKENIDKARQEVYLGVRGAFLPFLEGMQQDARGDTKVHKTASDAIEYLLVQGVCEVINHQVIPDLIIANFGDKCGIPTMTLGGTDWGETKAQLDVADILVNKFRIPVSRKSLYKVSQMEPPRDPEDEAGPAPLPPPPQNPPAGGFGFGQQFGSSGQGQPIQFVMMPYQSKPIAVEGGATINPVGTFSVANDTQQYADAFITNEQGQVLLLKRKSTDSFHPNEWCLPGGKIENGEDPLKAASREVQEETGLTVGLRPHKSYQNENGTISHTFAGDVGNAGVMLNGGEHTSHMWVDDTRKGYPQINFMLETKDRLDDYFCTNKETFSAEPTQAEEPKTPAPKIAIAGEDGQAAIHLVKSAMDDGKAVLESITRDAVERKLAGHTGPLFNAEETELLAEAIASTNATAELLGRYRIRERVKTQDQGKRFAALTPTSGPPLVKPLPPEAALEHFRALMPSLSPIPGFDERCRRTAFTLAVHTGEVMLRSMQDAIALALAEGRNGRKDVTDILTIAGVSPSNPQYADMVFRSNACDALNAGFDDERQAPDVIEEFPAWEYLGIEDGREGDDHRPKFGNYYPANVTFAQARGKRPFNCILPGQYVQGRVKTALKSFYSGKAFEIHTAGGSKFSVTANHPVLTDNGFVAAKMLKKSDRTLRYQGESQVGIVNVNEQYPPALIEDVFESMAVVFGSTRETPFSSFDLHGDAEFVEGEIEVVRADRSLQPAIKTGTQQSSMEPVLSRASVAFKGEPSRSPLALHLERIFHATSGFMSGFDLLHSKASIHLTPLESFRIGSASDLDVVFFEPTGQSASIESSLVSQLLERFTSEVSFDEIIEIRDFDYTGHVYDLETETGYLTVGSELYGVSTIISNCRCGSRAISRREWSRLLANGATFANVS